MDYEKSKSIVAHVDILGFKDLIESYESSKNFKVDKLGNFIRKAINQSYNMIKSIQPEISKLDPLLSFLETLKYRQFSDNFYFSVNYYKDEEIESAFHIISTLVALFQRLMLYGNIYVRGAISWGKNLCDENIIFSEALIYAVELENKIAIYPRIVIDNSLYNNILKNGKSEQILGLYPELFVKDYTNVIFINPFLVHKGNKFKMEKLGLDYQKMKDEVFIMNPENNNFDENVLANFIKDNSDEELIKIVKKDLNEKLIEFEEEYHIFEKYKWLSEYLNWIVGEPHSLIFKYC